MIFVILDRENLSTEATSLSNVDSPSQLHFMLMYEILYIQYVYM